jgi:hypothetical protein
MQAVRRSSMKQGMRRRQRDVLSAVMFSARDCETWLTLDELSRLTHYPPASISAQLRHLRKLEHGGYLVAKRQRKIEKALRGEDFGTVWEYQLRRGVRPEQAMARGMKRVARVTRGGARMRSVTKA